MTPIRLALALLLGLAAAPAGAVLQIDITRGNVEPLPIAITDLVSAGGRPEESRIGADMARVITANLQRSGLFRPIAPAAFIEKPEAIRDVPRFGDWRVINAQALVTGKLSFAADGRVRVEYQLWDVFAGQRLDGQALMTLPANWRRLGHIVSDAIYKRLTGEDGYFDSRVVFVSEAGPRERRIKRLALMDQDGENLRYLTGGQFLVLTPRFSPVAQEITYLSYFNNRPRVYIYNIDSGQQEVLGDFPGMTFAPRYAPDGKRVIMSLAQDGNTDIFVMDLRTRQIQRVTNHPAIDTAPSYSPDGNQVVFESDRGGTQQLYVVDAAGGEPKRISFGRGRFATPVWSPRGDLIAFTRIEGGRFFIGVMRPDGSGERLLTESWLDEGPTWAPNGRVLMYYRQTPSDDRGRGGSARLMSIDLTGYNERVVVTPTEASDPAWSPLGHVGR